jgi:hypothetical protein
MCDTRNKQFDYLNTHTTYFKKIEEECKIWGSHSGCCEDLYPLGYNAV